METSKKTLGKYLLGELNLRAKCSLYHLPLWQCPQFLFVVMGGMTIASILIFYYAFVGALDPYSIALLSLAIAGFLLIQAFIILHAFERSADANRMQAEFIGIASHQLRSPVTAARWALDFLVSDASRGLSAEAQNCVHIARDAVANIGQLVTAILRTVRIEAGTNTMRAEVFPLNPLVTEILGSAQKYAAASHIEIKSLMTERMLFVRTDREQIRFVIEHLLDNALRYSKRPGVVTFEFREDGDTVRCEVRDQGEGIPQHEQPHVFQKFFRASNAFTLAPSGAGLSLYAAKFIVEASGGHMGFRSVPEGGSMFWFTLPLVAKAPEAPL